MRPKQLDSNSRRGAVLIIVLALLALFVTVGITFAVITKVEGQGARNYKRFAQSATVGNRVALDSRQLFRFAISQLVYDTTDVRSALRGHSLLRDMYGSPTDNTGTADTGADPVADAFDEGTIGGNDYRGAFNGPGLMQPRHHAGASTGTDWDPLAVLEIRDYLKFQRSNQPLANPTLRTGTRYFFNFDVQEPEFPINFVHYDALGTRPAITAAETTHRHPEHFWDGAQVHLLGFDEDYDAADFNNMFLALERADGQILMPSFHRPYLVRQIEDAGEFTNLVHNNGGGKRFAAWRDPNGRKILLRPRELDVNASVVFNNVNRGNRWRDLLDQDGDGIVGNSAMELDVDTDGDGFKDSIWIDLGYPVQTAPDGTLFKPMFAFKVVDLDGKINLNVHGNLLAKDNDDNGDSIPDRDTGHTEAHVSNLGAAPTEVNPKHAMLLADVRPALNARLDHFRWRRTDPNDASDPGPRQYQDLLLGKTTGLRGRYNPTSGPIDIQYDRPGRNRNDDNTNTGFHPYAYLAPGSSQRTPYPGLIDLFGSGKYFEPFVDMPNVGNNPQSVYGRFLNYFQYGTNDWQASQAFNGINGLNNEAWLTTDESFEIDYFATLNLDDALYSAADLERLLRAEDLDATVLSERLTALLPNLFGDPVAPAALSFQMDREERYARQRMRRLFSHSSWDLVRFNNVPYFTEQTDNLNATNEWLTEDDADTVVGGSPFAHFGVFPGDNVQPNNAPEEFPEELARGLRLDLNRKLTSFDENAVVADQERTELAKDIYIALYLACRPWVDQPSGQGGALPLSNDQRIARSRVLAQIAVNIVDYRDSDHAMTYLNFEDELRVVGNQGKGKGKGNPRNASLQWNPPNDAEHKVFGFEMPRVVITEAAAVAYELGMSGNDRFWIWTELHNPWPGSPYPERDDNTSPELGVNLSQRTPGTDPVYKLRYRDVGGSGASADAVEDFDPAALGQARIHPKGVATSPPRNHFLVGPRLDPNGMSENPDALLPNWTEAENDFTSDRASATRVHRSEVNFEVSLYRLRNPYADHDDNTNPYIRLDHVILNDGTAPNEGGGYFVVGSGMSAAPPLNQRFSRVRRNPWHGEWHGAGLGWDPQTGSLTNNEESLFLGPPLATNPVTRPGFETRIVGSPIVHSLGKNLDPNNPNEPVVNDPLVEPFVVSFPFLNRELASPLELLHLRLYGSHVWSTATGPDVSGTAQAAEWRLRFCDDFEYERTTRHVRDRRVPWFDDNREEHPLDTDRNGDPLFPLGDLYRFFEFVECHSRMNGAVTMAQPDRGPTAAEVLTRRRRSPGKINLNTVTDEEVLRALVDEPEAMPAQPVDSSGVPLAPQRIPTNYYHADPLVSDFDWRRNRKTADFFLSQSQFGGGDIYFGTEDPATPPALLFVRRLWPGIDVDSASSSASVVGIPTGRYQFEQVHTELFRMLVLSRSGRDAIYGTGDDKPFRGFGSPRMSDTLLRRRNHARLDFPEGEPLGLDAGNNPSTTNTVGSPGGRGEYAQLEANGRPHWTPRLFDPVVNSIPDGTERIRSVNATDPTDPTHTGPLDLTGFPDPTAIDTWMLDHQQAKLLAKIGGNVTTRSNVFAVWVTVGYFVVEPGTQGSAVPCLNEELGIDSGTNVRHRMFCIIDRSKAEFYDGPRAIGNEPQIEDIDVLVLPNKVTIIE